MPERVSWAMYAAKGRLKATDGNTRWLHVPQPLMGNHWNHTAKTTNKTTPITNDGKLIPTIATRKDAASSNDPGLVAPRTPAVKPIHNASRMAQRPTVIETGNCAIKISLTVEV